jgi:hypothetical protein
LTFKLLGLEETDDYSNMIHDISLASPEPAMKLSHPKQKTVLRGQKYAKSQSKAKKGFVALKAPKKNVRIQPARSYSTSKGSLFGESSHSSIECQELKNRTQLSTPRSMNLNQKKRLFDSSPNRSNHIARRDKLPKRYRIDGELLNKYEYQDYVGHKLMEKIGTIKTFATSSAFDSAQLAMNNLKKKVQSKQYRTGRGMSIAELWGERVGASAYCAGEYFKAKNDLMNYERLRGNSKGK